MKLKQAHLTILKEIVCNEKISVYDISKNLVRDYGNTSRYKNDLLKWNLIHESERVLSATKSEKILYSPTKDGFVIYLRNYIESEGLYNEMKEKKLQKHKGHIEKIFSMYPDYFPNISANIHDILYLDLYTSVFFPFNVSMRALLYGCKDYLDSREEYIRNSDITPKTLETPLEIELNEKEIISMFEIPNKQTGTEIFENGVIKKYILEPPVYILECITNFPVNLLFTLRLSDIFDKSDNMKNLILDYFLKKEIYHSDYEKYYKKLSEIETSVTY